MRASLGQRLGGAVVAEIELVQLEWRGGRRGRAMLVAFVDHERAAMRFDQPRRALRRDDRTPTARRAAHLAARQRLVELAVGALAAELLGLRDAVVRRARSAGRRARSVAIRVGRSRLQRGPVLCAPAYR
jgi:hypothetical protein